MKTTFLVTMMLISSTSFSQVSKISKIPQSPLVGVYQCDDEAQLTIENKKTKNEFSAELVFSNESVSGLTDIKYSAADKSWMMHDDQGEDAIGEVKAKLAGTRIVLKFYSSNDIHCSLTDLEKVILE